MATQKALYNTDITPMIRAEIARCSTYTLSEIALKLSLFIILYPPPVSQIVQ